MSEIVVWALLILFIVIVTSPDFIPAFLVSLLLCGGLCALFCWIKGDFSSK